MMKNKSLYVIMFISLLIFFSVTFIFTETKGFIFDQKIIQWVDDVSNPFVVKLMNFVSLIGSSEVILLITLVITVLFLIKKDWYHTVFFLGVSVGGVFLNFLLKIIFQRERPGGDVSYIEVFNFSLEIPSYSFPSGHTMRSTILLLFLIYLSFRFIKNILLTSVATITCIILIVCVALSRLFLEAHYLSDTVAAISISIVWFSLIYMIAKKYDKKEETNAFYYSPW